MKFSAIRQGVRAERRVPMPGFDGVDILLRPINAVEEDDVLRKAFEHARRPGNDKPEPGDELYDLAVMAHTLEIGCLDPDSPPDARTLFFDGGAEQIRTALAVETIHYLYQHHDAWQDECSPYVRKLTGDELMDKVSEVAASDDAVPFLRMSPATRWLFMRTTARLLLDSHAQKSASGDSSQSGT